MLAELVKKRRETYVCNESLDVQKDDSIRKRFSMITNTITTTTRKNSIISSSLPISSLSKESIGSVGSVGSVGSITNENNNNIKSSNLLPAIAKSVLCLPPTIKDLENREAQLEKLMKSLPHDPKDNKSTKILEMKKLELRKEVIGGDFMNSYIDCYGNMITTFDVWQVREWQLLVFISSTFTDTRYERNILLDRILPYLRSTAYPHDIEVTFVDMRWGVRDEHTIDHKTWDECKREIKRCRDESCGLFFLSLQSDKYGYRPLPRKIDKRTFDARIENCENEDFKQLVHEWYICDSNAVPPEYVLKKLDSLHDQIYWTVVLPQLRLLLEGVRFDKNSSRHIEAGKSVSEWEVKYAVRNPDDSSRSLWIRRQFPDEYNDEQYCDTKDNQELQTLKGDLIEWMDVNIGPTRKKFYNGLVSYKAIKEQKTAFQRYSRQWEDDITVLLLKELRKIIRLRTQWDVNGCGLGLSGHVATEFLHHSKIAHDLCIEFAGREELLQTCMDILRQPNKHSKDKRSAMIQAALETKSSSTSNYSSVSLVLYGESGSGKSAFIAKLADEIFQHEVRGDYNHILSSNSSYSMTNNNNNNNNMTNNNNNNNSTPATTTSSTQRRGSDSSNTIPYLTFTKRKSSKKIRKPPRPVIFRFCGTSENSLHSRSVIRSLRLQIQYLLGPTSTHFPKPPSDWEILNDLLKHHAVIILLDGVNTLDGGFEFLSHLTLHKDTRIIVSLSGNTSNSSNSLNSMSGSNSPTSRHNHRNIEYALELFRNDEVTCVEVKQPSNDIRHIMESILHKKHRALTESQWDIVLQQAEVEPSAIYMSLALKIVEHWPSYLQSPVLASSLPGVVGQILDHVEIECGTTLCRAALGLITLSVRGINDNEMEDMLSLDQEVLRSVFQYDVPNVSRIPTHVWTKLRRHMEGLLIERHHGCLTWRHDSLLEIALKRYSQEKIKFHNMLANYFGNRIDPVIRNEKKIASYDLLMSGGSVWLKNSRPNYRRCEEAVYSLIHCGNLIDAVNSLCDFDYICAAYRCNEGSATIQYLELIIKKEKIEKKGVDLIKIRDYLQWLKRADSRILDDPQIFIPVTVTLEPITSIARQDYIRNLVENPAISNHKNNQTFTGDVWIRGMSLGSILEDNSSLIRGSVCISWSPNSDRLLTVADDRIRIWNTNSAETLMELRNRNHKTVTEAYWSNDGNRLLCKSWDGTASVWSLNQKVVLFSLDKHIHVNITAIAWNPLGSQIITGSQDSLLMLWDANDGSYVSTIKKVNDYYILSITWSPDGKDIAIVTLSTHIHIYRTETKEEIHYLQHTNQVNTLSWNHNGNLIASGSDDDTVKIWNPYSNITLLNFTKHQCAVRAVSWCSDGDRIASGDECGKILIWHWSTQNILASWNAHTDSIHTLIWSPDMMKLASSSKDGTVVVWESSEEIKKIGKKKRFTKIGHLGK